MESLNQHTDAAQHIDIDACLNTQYQAWLAEHDDEPRTIWFGPWTSNLDGRYEVRTSVAKSDEGFLPGLEVSFLGGDFEPDFGEALPTLELAIQAARAREDAWHEQDANDE